MTVAGLTQGEPKRGQPLTLVSGVEAVTLIERSICGDAVAQSPSVAEGLALAGRRAASVANGAGVGSSGGERLPASCVHHVAGGVLSRDDDGWAFELAAATAQEAADHCLAAHMLSQRVGRAGLCTVSPSTAERLDTLRLVLPTDVASLLDSVEAEASDKTLSAGRVLELAQAAFMAVGEKTGRPLELVRYEGDIRADVVLMAAGSSAVDVREAAKALNAAGISAATLTLSLVRPFPGARVAQALAHAKQAFVVDASHRAERLRELTDCALDGRLGADSLRALETDGTTEGLMDALAAELPAFVFGGEAPRTEAEPLSSRLIAAPAGAWGEEITRRVAAALGQVGALRVGQRTHEEAGATVLDCGGEAMSVGAGGTDLMFASHLSVLTPEGPLGLLRAGGTIVLQAAAAASEDLVRMMRPEQREMIHERNLRVHWLDASDAAAIVGAALSWRLARQGSVESRQDALARIGETLGDEQAARFLQEGAAKVRRLDFALLDPARVVEEEDFRPTTDLPGLPAVEESAEAREKWHDRLTRFHLRGSSEGLPLGTPPAAGVRPAVWGGIAKDLKGAPPYPAALVRGDDAEQPVLGKSVSELVAKACEERAVGRVLADNSGRLGLAIRQLLMERPLATPLGELVEAASGQLVEALGLPEAEQGELVGDLRTLAESLPKDAPLFDLRETAPLEVYLAVQRTARASAEASFVRELRSLAEKLENLLLVERIGSDQGRTPEALKTSLGEAGAFLDLTVLSATIDKSVATTPLGDERRARIETTLATIRAFLDHRDGLPTLVLLQPTGSKCEALLPGEIHITHSDPLLAAMGLYDGLARRMGTVFRAVRVARLEIAGTYQPEIHDSALADLSWQAFAIDELALAPAVTVQIDGARLRQGGLASLSSLLLSSRPIHVIVLDEVAARDEANDLSRYHVDLGYLAMAHREALVAQSSLSRPARLVEDVLAMAKARRPAVLLVGRPTGGPAALRSLRSEAALQGRAWPELRYDPDSGTSWADRIDLGENPQPEQAWPMHRLRYQEAGEEKELEVAFSWADAVALEPVYHRHFLVIPPEAWSDEQAPLADYVAQFEPEGGGRALPYVWVVDENRVLQRAIVTRELAMACVDRLRAWHVLQELGGFDNSFVERAVEEARKAAQEEAQERLREAEAAHTEEVERVRAEAARESMERLASVLMDVESLSLAAPSATPAAAGPAPAVAPAEAAPAAAAPAAPAEEEEALSFDEPYIDTVLCTSCNECTNLNSRLFVYNANKQAELGDVNAGTFAELVRAAEVCPGKCIHPGKPRSGDGTATPEMVERAAKFN